MLQHDPVSLQTSNHEIELARRETVMDLYELSIEEHIDELLMDPENVGDIMDRIGSMGKGHAWDCALLHLANSVDRDHDHETVYNQALKIHSFVVGAAREIAKDKADKEAVKRGYFR